MEYLLRENKFTVADFKGLIEILNEDAGEEVKAYISNNRLFVSANVANTYLMLRFSDDNMFVIANIELEHQRVGTGRHILEWCSEFASENGFTSIQFESVLTIAMEKFVKKFGFRKLSDRNSERNWIKEL